MKTILVVEDNDKNLYLIRFIIEKMGHRVIEAKTGEEGVERAISDRPDLILMDIQLPGIDGLEATRRIRTSRANGDTPIVAITSHALVGDKDAALKAGCTGYIEKPINPETIMSELTRYLSGNPDAVAREEHAE